MLYRMRTSFLVRRRVPVPLGHSRGVIVNSEAARRFARSGIAIDHVTGLDPHPVNGTLDAPLDFDWGDPAPRTWSNMVFADVYYRADGGDFNATDFDGIPIDGAVNTEARRERAQLLCVRLLALGRAPVVSRDDRSVAGRVRR